MAKTENKLLRLFILSSIHFMTIYDSWPVFQEWIDNFHLFFRNCHKDISSNPGHPAKPIPADKYYMSPADHGFTAELFASLPIPAALSAMPTENAQLQFPDHIYSVADFGAAADGIQDDTVVIQKALDYCADEGGGTVIIPEGAFRSGPLFIKSHTRLELCRNSTLLMINDESRFLKSEAGKGKKDWHAFLNIENADQIAIVGEGTIDGQGAAFWERWRAEVCRHKDKSSTNRPRLVVIENTENVLVNGITLANSPSFHLVMRNSRNIDINAIQIIAPAHSPNTDGINLLNCRKAGITNCIISTGDDHIAIKASGAAKRSTAASSDIQISGCVFLNGRGLSFGNETMGGIRNITACDNSFFNSMYGIRIKTSRGKGGEVSKLVFKKTVMKDVKTCFVFSGYYCAISKSPKVVDSTILEGGFILGDQLYPGQDDPEQVFDAATTPNIHDITIEDCECTGNTINAGFIIGLPEKHIKNIAFKQVSMESEKSFLIRNAMVSTSGLEIFARTGEQIHIQKNGSINKL